MNNKPLYNLWHSIRTRIMLSVLVMVFPAAVLMYSAYSSIHSGIESLDQIIDTPVQKLIVTKEVQNMILRTELPFYLYMNRGETADRESFIRRAVDIDLLFNKFSALIGKEENDHRLLETAQAEWHEAKSLGESLLTLSNIPDSTVLMAKTDQFSRHLERAVAMLEEFSEHAVDEIQNQRFIAQDNELNTIGILTLVFALGLLLALLASISLGQSVIAPIRNLEKTVNRFGRGDTSSRVTINSKDELGSLASAFNQLAERYEHIKHELEYLSIHDNLTGLYNQSKLLKEINTEIERAKRYHRSFSIVLIDIENFKNVNQTYGHLVGDSVLCSVANKIKSTIRPTDIAARYGGDEFAIILSETDTNGAKDSTQRLIDAIEQHPLNIGDGKTLKIDIKISQATYPQDAETETSLVALAERTLSTNNRHHSLTDKQA